MQPDTANAAAAAAEKTTTEGPGARPLPGYQGVLSHQRAENVSAEKIREYERNWSVMTWEAQQERMDVMNQKERRKELKEILEDPDKWIIQEEASTVKNYAASNKCETCGTIIYGANVFCEEHQDRNECATCGREIQEGNGGNVFCERHKE